MCTVDDSMVARVRFGVYQAKRTKVVADISGTSQTTTAVKIKNTNS